MQNRPCHFSTWSPVYRTYVFISSIVDELPAVKRTELEVFSGGDKTSKTGPNSSACYPSRSFQPALKPILERFEFVKLSRFSPLVTITPANNHYKKKGKGLPSPAIPIQKLYLLISAVRSLTILIVRELTDVSPTDTDATHSKGKVSSLSNTR